MRGFGYWIRIRNDIVDGMEPECFTRLDAALKAAKERVVDYYVNTTAEVWYDRVDIAPFQAHDNAFNRGSSLSTHIATVKCELSGDTRKAVQIFKRSQGWR